MSGTWMARSSRTAGPLRLSSSPEPVSDRPSVLFVCLKNSGRSQLAAGLFRELTGNTFDVSSAGTKADRRSMVCSPRHFWSSGSMSAVRILVSSRTG